MAGQKWICLFTPLGLLLLSVFVHYSEASITKPDLDQCDLGNDGVFPYEEAEEMMRGYPYGLDIETIIMLFSKYDLDNNWKLVREEYYPFCLFVVKHDNPCDQFDLNYDGIVSLQEAEEVLQKPPFNFPILYIHNVFKKYSSNKGDVLKKGNIEGFCSIVYSATPDDMKPDLDQCDQFDLDNDGVVSVKEAEEKMRQPPFSLPIAKILMLFSKYDLDNNWKLAQEEFYPFCSFAKELANPCGKFDLNNDDIISFDEAEEVLQKPPFNFPIQKINILFKKNDLYNNTALSGENIHGFCLDVYSAITFVIETQLDLCHQFDLNNDGVVSVEEAKEKMQQPPFSLPIAKILMLFSKYDLDNNWKLSREELFSFCLSAQPSQLLSHYLTANFIGWAPQVGSQLATLPVENILADSLPASRAPAA